MHRTHECRSKQSRVTAVFEDRALSFLLAKDATLGELSDRLDELGRRKGGTPLAITVKFSASSWNTGSKPICRPDFEHAT
jgi:hypothetical protein